MATPALTSVVAGGVGTITLNRPDALNALDLELKTALLEALLAAKADTNVRALIITGAGRAFCAGQDLREHAAELAEGRAIDTVADHLNPIALALADLSVPVIAAVNGVAAGAGASLALGCDFRLVADTGSFLMAFARVGLGPDTGVSWTLQRLIGTARATALLMLAEPVTAEQALEMGMVNAVVPAAELARAATALAVRLASGPTVAYGAIKATTAYAASHTLAESLAEEAVHQRIAGASEDHAAAVRSFLGKQEASFHGR